MQREYESSFDIWKECQPDGRLVAEPTIAPGIWMMFEKESEEFGYVFCDETENFFPRIYPSIEDAIKGREDYCQHELGVKY